MEPSNQKTQSDQANKKSKDNEAVVAGLRELTDSLEIMQHQITALENGLAFNPITPPQSQESATIFSPSSSHKSEEVVHLKMIKDLAKKLRADATSCSTKEHFDDIRKRYNEVKQQFDASHAKFAQQHPSQEMSQLDSLDSQPDSLDAHTFSL